MSAVSGDFGELSDFSSVCFVNGAAVSGVISSLMAWSLSIIRGDSSVGAINVFARLILWFAKRES